MDARQMAAMAEATRLTRQGRLVEATALIQQTLAGPAVTRRAPDAPCAGQAGGEPGRSVPATATVRGHPRGDAGWSAGPSRLGSRPRALRRPARARSPAPRPARGPGRGARGGPV